MLYILRDGLPGIAGPLDDQTLASAHPAWIDGIRSARWAPSSLNGHNVLSAETYGTRTPLTNSSVAPENEGSTFLCGTSTSSLDAARRLAEDGTMHEWESLLAVTQTAGRGQLRRPWNSPAGNIFAALRIPFGGPHLDDFAPLTVGYLFAHAFRHLGVNVDLKWPNDLLLNGSKTGGILIEQVGDTLTAGVGINLVSSPPTSLLREGWSVPATSLRECGANLSVMTLWQTLVNRVRFCYETEVVRCNREELTRRVQIHLAWVGRDVNVHGGDEDYRPGRLLGVNENGALRLLLSGHECAITSGSISLSSHADIPQ